MKTIKQIAIILILNVVSTTGVLAQVGFGTNAPNASAAVDITATNKGLLLPRVALSSTTVPLSGNGTFDTPNGMVVYNTATAGDVTPGSYYSDGTKWCRLASASAFTGATGTTAGTAGIVPAPAAGTNVQVLRGDATFANNIPAFVASTYYPAGYIIQVSGQLYSATANFTSGATFDITKWSSATTPAGTVVVFAGSTPPAGWFLCDGSAVSRTTYASLYAAIGIAYGYGDNSSTFNVPDLRGAFVRGVDGTAGRDPDKASRTALNAGGNTGNNIGSYQADAFASHTHSLSSGAYSSSSCSSNKGWSSDDYPCGSDTKTTTSSGGSETRPKNVAMNYIIKY